MAEHAVVLPGTSEIDFPSHAALADIGPIGDGRGRGILPHNGLAIVPGSRHVLGLARQQLRIRKPAPENETSGQREIRDRESALGTNGIAAIGRRRLRGDAGLGERGSRLPAARLAESPGVER